MRNPGVGRKDFESVLEDYLGVMYVLERDGQPVVGAHLAELLGVSPPTVTNTFKRMLRDGLITLWRDYFDPEFTSRTRAPDRCRVPAWMAVSQEDATPRHDRHGPGFRR